MTWRKLTVFRDTGFNFWQRGHCMLISYFKHCSGWDLTWTPGPCHWTKTATIKWMAIPSMEKNSYVFHQCWSNNGNDVATCNLPTGWALAYSRASSSHFLQQPVMKVQVAVRTCNVFPSAVLLHDTRAVAKEKRKSHVSASIWCAHVDAQI